MKVQGQMDPALSHGGRDGLSPAVNTEQQQHRYGDGSTQSTQRHDGRKGHEPLLIRDDTVLLAPTLISYGVISLLYFTDAHIPAGDHGNLTPRVSVRGAPLL